MLADSPSNYRREPESLAFLAAVPSVWDETRVLSANVGEHILVARRSGREWYVGALTNWTPATLDVDLSFLGAGAFQAVIFRDGVNAHRAGVDYAREEKSRVGGRPADDPPGARRRMGGAHRAPLRDAGPQAVSRLGPP